MYARSTTLQVRPDAMDDAVTMMRDDVWPAMRDMDGCVGMSMMCDRGSGRCIISSAWEDRAALMSSADRVAPMRRRMQDKYGNGAVEVQEWEIAVVHREQPTGDAGACARMTWVRAEAGRVDEMADFYRGTLMPRILAYQGFRGLTFMVDRDTGMGVSTVTFASRADMEATREQANANRSESARTMGLDIVDIAEMDVVLAHLRVPETV
jgi:quinol monooxygenase YgiN